MAGSTWLVSHFSGLFLCWLMSRILKTVISTIFAIWVLGVHGKKVDLVLINPSWPEVLSSMSLVIFCNCKTTIAIKIENVSLVPQSILRATLPLPLPLHGNHRAGFHSYSFAFPRTSYKWVIQYAAFGVWFLSVHKMLAQDAFTSLPCYHPYLPLIPSYCQEASCCVDESQSFQ